MKQIIVLVAFTSVLAIALGRNLIPMERVATRYVDYRCPQEIRYDMDGGIWEVAK